MAHSRQVTDNGVRDLLVSVELKDKGQNEADQGSREQQQKSPQRWNKFKMLAKFVPWMRNDNSGLCSHLSVLPRAANLNIWFHCLCVAEKQRKVLLHYCERRNALCSTMHTFDISNTGVTSAGVLLALNHAPRLQSFGDYAHTGTALEALDKTPVTQDDPHNK